MEKKDNINDKNINYEEEGVFYTPSKEAENLTSSNSDKNKNIAKSKKEKKNNIKKYPLKKSNYQTFVILSSFAGVIIFTAVLVVICNNLRSDSKQIKKYSDNYYNVYEQTSSEYNYKEETLSTAEKEYIGVIRTKSESFDSLTIYNITADENADYKLTGGTEIRDEYGKIIIPEELSEGDLIAFIYDKDNNLTSLKKTKDGFSETLENGFKIDTDKMTISAEMKTYSYSEMTRFIYRGEEFDPALLDPTIDIITISGYGNRIWTMTLNKGHGTLDVIQNDKIKNGIIEIDTDIYKKLSDVSLVKLNEGVHKIVVKGSNIDTYVKEIGLGVNEKYTLNLSEIKVRAGKVAIKANEKDFALYINGKLELSRDPLELEYGKYTIEIIKQGYTKYNSEFIVNSPEKVINVQLTKEIKMGTLTVNSTPSGATLLIDGVSVGTTPYSSDIEQGQHSITLKKDGYKDISITSINISEQESVYNVELQKEQQ